MDSQSAEIYIARRERCNRQREQEWRQGDEATRNPQHCACQAQGFCPDHPLRRLLCANRPSAVIVGEVRVLPLLFLLFESLEVVNEFFFFSLKLLLALNEVAGYALGTVLGFVIFPPVVNVSQRKREGKRCRQWKADGKEHEERGCQKW